MRKDLTKLLVIISLLVILIALPVTVFLVQRQQTYLGQAVDEDSPIKTTAGSFHAAGYCFNIQTDTDECWQDLAKHYGLLRDRYGLPKIDSGIPAETINKLHQYNPKIIILKYHHISCVHGVYSGRRKQDPEMYDFIYNQHSDWLLRDQKGNIVHTDTMFGFCPVLNPKKRAANKWLADIVVNYFKKPYDGVYFDISGPNTLGFLKIKQIDPQTNEEYDSIPIDPNTGQPYTHIDWARDQAARLKFVKSEIKSRVGDKLVIFNVIPRLWSAYNDTYGWFWEESDTDGAQIDGFLGNMKSLDPDKFTAQDWIEAINVLADTIRKTDQETGKRKIMKVKVLPTSKADYSYQERERLCRYAFASYLMAIAKYNDHSYFNGNCYLDEELTSHDDRIQFQYALGKPTKNSQLKGNQYVSAYKIPGHRSYRRDFENGVVLVNSSKYVDRDIDLGGTYYLGKDAVTKVTVGARNAKILTKEPQISPPPSPSPSPSPPPSISPSPTSIPSPSPQSCFYKVCEGTVCATKEKEPPCPVDTCSADADCICSYKACEGTSCLTKTQVLPCPLDSCSIDTECTTPSAHLNFKIKFQGISSQKPNKTVRLILKQGGEVKYSLDSLGVSSDQNGVFSGTATDIDPGTYDVHIKGWVQLQKTFENVALIEGENSLDWSSIELLTGDATGDNKINIQDFRVLAENYLTSSILADFNLDGIINIQDYRFIAENYLKEGEQ